MAGDRYAQALAQRLRLPHSSPAASCAHFESPISSVLPPGRCHPPPLRGGARGRAAAGGLYRSVRSDSARPGWSYASSAPIEMGAGRARGARQPDRAPRRGAARHRYGAAGDGRGEQGGTRGVDNLSYVRISEDTSPVVRLVHSTVYDALVAGASDIHLESNASGLVVRYRLDGVLASITTVQGRRARRADHLAYQGDVGAGYRRAARPAGWAIQDARHQRPPDRLPACRSSPAFSARTRCCAILDKQALTKMSGLRLRCAGFRVEHRRAGCAAWPRWRLTALLVTGPTGSGKTTTLYAAISETQTGNDKIVTIEDPVEYQLQGVLQIPVNEKKGLTFARAGARSLAARSQTRSWWVRSATQETRRRSPSDQRSPVTWLFTTVRTSNIARCRQPLRAHGRRSSHGALSALSAVHGATPGAASSCEQCSEACPRASCSRNRMFRS